MGSWDFENIGFSCNESNYNLVKRLLYCMGVFFDEFENMHGSEVGGPINYKKWEYDEIGYYLGEYEPIIIYSIVNKICNNTTIYYEHELGSNTADYYYRYEEIYNPQKNKMYIGEYDVCDDDYTVFGKNVYEIIKDECEIMAKEKGIPLEWDEYQPKGEEFDLICHEIIEKHGGLEKMGKRKATKKIPNIEIDQKVIIQIIDEADEGYDDIIQILKKSYNVDYTPTYHSLLTEDEAQS